MNFFTDPLSSGHGPDCACQSFLGLGPYLSRGNCIRILWQKMKCIRILGHKWNHMDSDQINVFSACHNFKTNGNDLVVLING